MKTLYVIIASATLPLALGCGSRSHIQPSTPTEFVPPDGRLVHDYDKWPVKVETGNPEIDAGATYSRLAKKVRLKWGYPVTGLQEGPFTDPTRWSNEQEFAVSFYPTDVACIDADRLAVAGRTLSGEAIVELWSWATPSQPALRFDTQGNSHPGEIRVRERRERVFTAPVAARGDVSAVFRNWGDSSRPLMFFNGDSVVCELNLVSGETTVIAGVGVDQGALEVPGLDHSHLRDIGSRVVGSSSHEVAWYMFHAPMPDELGDEPGITLLLIDDDSDGSLDRYESFPDGSPITPDLMPPDGSFLKGRNGG